MKIERFLGLQDLPVRFFSDSLYQARKITYKYKIPARLGLEDSHEVAYLVATMAWDFRRKEGHENGGYLIDPSRVDTIRRISGASSWITRLVDGLSETERQTIQGLDQTRDSLRVSSPSLTHLSPVFDRVSNMITSSVIEARQQKIPISKMLKSQGWLIDKFGQEILQARQQF